MVGGTLATFCPEVFKCTKCQNKISLEYSSFMPPCCGIGLFCNGCARENQREMCANCKKWGYCVKIEAQFFGNIEKTAWELVEKWGEGRNDGIRELTNPGGVCDQDSRYDGVVMGV